MGELKAYLEERGLPVREISGASSATCAWKAQGGVYTELQAGSYIFMDQAFGGVHLPFQRSLTVLATVPVSYTHLQYIPQVQNPIERDVYISKIADELSVSKEALTAQVQNNIKRQANSRRRSERRDLRVYSEVQPGHKPNPERSQNIHYAPVSYTHLDVYKRQVQVKEFVHRVIEDRACVDSE